MSIKERREREKQELRQGILTAAREIAAEEGWQAVTIRKVAEGIEYSPPTIYEYFPSKDAILVELMSEGFRALHSMMQAAVESTDDPDSRLVQLAIAHCEFAWDHPELYQVMHGLGGASCSATGEHTPPKTHSIGTIIVEEVRNALQPTPEDEEALHDAMAIRRARLHGIASLSISGVLEGGRERATQLAERSERDWLLAWRAGRSEAVEAGEPAKEPKPGKDKGAKEGKAKKGRTRGTPTS